MANVVSMKQLLEAGVHFDIDKKMEPKMADYIFTERNGIYIIDLQKTVKKLDEAYICSFVISQQRAAQSSLLVQRSRLRNPLRKKQSAAICLS